MLAMGAGAVLQATGSLHANINLELRGLPTEVCSGDTIDIGLYAVSDDASNQSMGGAEVILAWDPLQLALIAKVDNGPYLWLASFFPNDSGGDGLNAPFQGPVPGNDGNALYSVFGQFAPATPAQATPQGLLVTTFRFQAVRPGDARVSIPAQFGTASETQVVDGAQPGLVVTGTLPSIGTTVSCPEPSVVEVTSRRLFVTAPTCPATVALWVHASPGQPDASCYSAYVQADGTLGPAPVFFPPQEWGTVEIRGEYLLTDTSYVVQSDCGTIDLAGYGGFDTAPTWGWGDINGSGDADLSDLLLALDGFAGIFVVATPNQVDIMPCLPDGQVDLSDILGVLDAFTGQTFLDTCLPPCP